MSRVGRLTASMARVRIVLMNVVSSGCPSDLIPGFGSTAVAIDAFLLF